LLRRQFRREAINFSLFTARHGEALLGRYSTTRSTAFRDAPTRERVLIAASELFATQGYAGTSTRQIASKVGMQQPSLFHHFSTKSAIMHELLRYSLEWPLRWKAILAKTPTSSATKLYCYFCLDVRHVIFSPYNIAGLDHDNVTKLEEFNQWLSVLRELRAYRNALVDEAVRTGEFIAWPVNLLRGSISNIVLSLVQRERTIRIPVSRANEVAHCVASFLVRAMLTDTNDLPSIRAKAEEIKMTMIQLENLQH
jgi:AcrR family transcriptional regulator